ncbi:hypothetical protein [Pseudonocardia sp. GCM10023141]|uniref:hypothetical protein n=1 Tax=Pseudonocardia sp. GCM10023141 TaxID=3252653 RepID=UPI00360F1A18
MLGSKRRRDAHPVVPAMQAAFAAAGIDAQYVPGVEFRIAVPGVPDRFPMSLQPLLDGFPAGGAPTEFAEGVVRGFVRSMRRNGVPIGRPDLQDGPDAPAPQPVALPAELISLSSAALNGHEADLRIRLYTADTLPEPLRGGMVSRELAAGLWETVAVDRPDSVQPLPRAQLGVADHHREQQLFDLAVANTVEDPFTLTPMEHGGVTFLHIGGEHRYLAAHAYVLSRYLDGPVTDGALVSFPLPEVMLVHALGQQHPAQALGVLQDVGAALVASGTRAISSQVFWWVPSERERAAPGRDAAAGHRPDLRPQAVQRTAAGLTLSCDDDFHRICARFATSTAGDVERVDREAPAPEPVDITSAELRGHETGLRLRLHAAERFAGIHRSAMVSRELAPELWESVLVDRPESIMPLRREKLGSPDPDREPHLFDLAVANTVEEPFTLSTFEDGNVAFLKISGELPCVAAHVYVLSRYLHAPIADGALVSFPTPESMLVHAIGPTHPAIALGVLQQITARHADGAAHPVSKQVFWWVPSERERAAPGRDAVAGHRPALRPARVDRTDKGFAVHCDEAFQRLCDRFAATNR